MLFQIKAYILSLFMAFNMHVHPTYVQELSCMAQAVYYEAGAEPTKGKIAVANVIINRTNHKSFPSTICGVVNQKSQFSYLSNVRRLDLQNPLVVNQLRESIAVSMLVMRRKVKDNTHGSLFYVNPRTATNTKWLSNMRKTVVINNHTFYIHRKKQEKDKWRNTV